MTTTPEFIRNEDRNRVRWLTLNRPKALNAFNDQMYLETAAALKEAATDPNLAVVVITGEGRAFSAGQDLAELDRSNLDPDQEPGFPVFIATLEAFPKPIIAAVNGIGIGIGLTMLPHCDLVLMVAAARLKTPFPTLGVTVEAGNSFLLPARVGWQNAAHILYTAEWVSAEVAVAQGLVWKVVADDQLLAETTIIAEQIAAMPISSLQETKQLLLAPRLDATRQARVRENAAFGRLVGAPANREAIAAFQEKRPADFTNLPAE